MRQEEKVSVPPEYRWRYEMCSHYGYTDHTWYLVGARGGVHLHISDRGEDAARTYGRYSGGVECHYRTAPSHMKNRPPSHDECNVLKAPCWHDGSSLLCSDTFIPAFEHGASHNTMFGLLVGVANDWLSTKTEDE